MAALFAGVDDSPGAVAGAATGLRIRAAALAQDDLAVYAAYVAARRLDPRGVAVLAALDEAVRVPLEVAAIGAELAELAAGLAVAGNPRLRGDAATGALLAVAATRSAAVLVCENLLDRPDDPRLARAAALVTRAAAAEHAVLSAYPVLHSL